MLALSRLARQSHSPNSLNTLLLPLRHQSSASQRKSTQPSPVPSETGAAYKRSSSTPSKYQHPMSPYLPVALGTSSDILVDHAEGSYIYSTDGRKVLDFTMGIGVTNLGHCHPVVNRAAVDQISRGVHLQQNCVLSQPVAKLAEKIINKLPSHFQQIVFSNSGAEAVENAVKLARHYTKKTNIITVQGSFHGRTIATGALTNAKYVYRSGFQPSMSGVHVVPFPYCHRCAISENCSTYSYDNCCMDPMTQLHRLLKSQSSADETAALLVEPVLGEGGYVAAPKKWLQAVRKLCTQNNILMILDEVQSGYGRTGTLFAMEQYGVVPDILVMAKGIANGFPLSAIATSEEIFSKQKPGSIGGTYSGNAVSAAAGIAVLDVIEQENILQNVQERGEQFRAGLKKLQKKFPISDVRGLGLMNAIELSDSAGAGVASAIQKAMLKHNVLVLTAGIHEALRFIPALNVNEQEINIGLNVIETALVEVFGDK